MTKKGTTLANMTDSGPMIFGMRLKVTTFNGLSLTTRASFALLINPPVTHHLRLQEWYNENKDELQEMLDMKTYNNTDMLLPFPKQEDIIPIATAVSSLKVSKTGWIKGKTTLPKQERSCWYTACANCQKSIEADITWIVTFPSCKLESEVHPMSRLMIIIDDETASTFATISTPEVEKLIPFNAVQLMEAEENRINLHHDIATSLQQQTVVAFVRSYEASFHGQTELKLNVVKVYKEATVSHLRDSTPATVEQPSPSIDDVVTHAVNLKGKEQQNTSIMPSQLIKRPSSFTTQTEPQAQHIAIKKEVNEVPTKKTKKSSN